MVNLDTLKGLSARAQAARQGAGNLLKRAEARAAELATAAEHRVSKVEAQLLHHAGKVDAQLQGERPEITDPAVLKAVDSASNVIGHRYLVVNGYGVFPTFSRVVEDAATARQHAGDALAEGDRSSQVLTLLKSGYNTVRGLVVEQAAEDKVEASFMSSYASLFGARQETATSIMQEALSGSGAFAHVTSAPEAAMRALLLSLEGPMGTIRKAITNPKENSALIDAAITDETLERLGKTSDTVQHIVDSRGLHRLFHAVAQPGTKGGANALLREAPISYAMQQAEARGVDRESAHGLRALFEQHGGLLSGLIEEGSPLMQALKEKGLPVHHVGTARRILGRAGAVSDFVSERAVKLLPGATQLDGLLRQTAGAIPTEYNEALKRALITGMKTILETPNDARGQVVAEMVVALEGKMNKHTYGKLRRFGRWAFTHNSFTDMLEKGINKRGKARNAELAKVSKDLADLKVELGMVGASHEAVPTAPVGRTNASAPVAETVVVPDAATISYMQKMYQSQIDGLTAQQANLAGDAIEDRELLDLFRLAHKYTGKGK